MECLQLFVLGEVDYDVEVVEGQTQGEDGVREEGDLAAKELGHPTVVDEVLQFGERCFGFGVGVRNILFHRI